MKKLLLLGTLVIGGLTTNAQTTLFSDDFESYENFEFNQVGDWTLIDQDGAQQYGFQGVAFPGEGQPKAFVVFNSTATQPPLSVSATDDWTARSGEKAMVAFASVDAVNNDWMITPAITLGSEGNRLSFWAKAANSTYGAEQFNVRIATEIQDLNSFNTIASVTITESLVWTEYTYNLDDYVGQTVYLAIQCVSNDQFGFVVDDFSVTTGNTVSVDSYLASQFTVFPNPVNDVLSISNTLGAEINAISVTDINGRVVKQINANVEQVNVSDLNAGVYFLNINSTEGNLTKKIVKK
ncbi:MAG: choice-of-anchor J domain-containing protein [Bacteroidota bacterium]|nr:choice-of-anchor J domain-containing protein [Bacteroidota bacterium]